MQPFGPRSSFVDAPHVDARARMLPPARGARAVGRGGDASGRGWPSRRGDARWNRRRDGAGRPGRAGEARARVPRGVREPNGSASGSSPASASSPAGDGAKLAGGSGGGLGNLWERAQAFTKKASEKGAEWATQTQNDLTTKVNEKVKLMQPQMEVAVDYFGPTTRQLKELVKPVTEPLRKEWMKMAVDTRRMVTGAFWGSILGNFILGWPARGERNRLRKKVEEMQLERTKMLVDDFSLEREVLALNAENRRLEKRTLRAEMALNAIKRRLGEYVVQPKDESVYADPNLSGVLPGAPWANDLLDAVGQRMQASGEGGERPSTPQA